MTATLVTSLYDINRSTLDGRTWDEYLEWFAKTLQLKSPMVVFVDRNLVDFVKDNRKDLPTKIIEQKLEEIPYYHLKDKMDSIIESKEYKSKISDPNRIECKSSLYNIIQYSKFKWMETAIDENYFDTEYFIWVDAGLSRFFYDLNTNKPYPGNNALESLLEIKDKVLIQVQLSYYPDLSYAETLTESYLTDNRSYIMGGMFGAGKDGIKNLCPIIDQILDKMIGNNFINNEQIALGYLFKTQPDLFEVFYNEAHLHRGYELILELGK